MTSSRLGDFFEQRQEPGEEGLPTFSVTMNDGLVPRDDLERRTETNLRPDQHLRVRKGDIAYNMMRMWQGACGLAEADGNISPAYVVMAPKSGIDTRFALHWFKSARMIHLFWAYSHGLTEDRLRLYAHEFAQIPASPPSMEQQRRITTILDAWDHAINQAERLVDVSRKRRAALMLALFGQAKITFEKELPAGWDRACVGDLCSFSNGLWAGKKAPFVRVGVIRNTNFTEDGTLDYSDVAHLEVEEKQFQTRRLQVGDIILEKSGGGPDQPVGRVALFDRSNGLYSFSNFTSVLRVTDSSRIDYRYIHQFLHWVYLSGLTEVMQARSTGLRNLDSEAYKRILVPIPPLSQQGQIATALEAAYTLIFGYVDIARVLRSQRRGLMQKLLIGDWQLDDRFDLPSTTKAVADGVAQ